MTAYPEHANPFDALEMYVKARVVNLSFGRGRLVRDIHQEQDAYEEPPRWCEKTAATASCYEQYVLKATGLCETVKFNRSPLFSRV